MALKSLVTINGIVATIQPDTIDWSRPNYGNTGNGVPVDGPYYTCILGFSRRTVVQLEQWFRHKGEEIDMHLPHVKTGKTTEFTDVIIHSIEQRMDIRDPRLAASDGVDITVIKIDMDVD